MSFVGFDLLSRSTIPGVAWGCHLPSLSSVSSTRYVMNTQAFKFSNSEEIEESTMFLPFYGNSVEKCVNSRMEMRLLVSTNSKSIDK